jgi:hypothetical protein
VLLQQDDVRAAGFGQVIQDAAAGDTPADDDNPGLVFHGMLLDVVLT